jgi:hypothetical protein
LGPTWTSDSAVKPLPIYAAETLSSAFDYFFNTFFTVVTNGLTARVQNPCGAQVAHLLLINVQNFCKEKDLGVCGIKLYLPNCTIGLLNIYRSPSGNFKYFFNKLETLLNCISINSLDLII